ncbi:ketopantoate reductase family protein [Cohnella panacarvi]|uniref:ketopantoate reductase family protein n=1 Tax=Cohnella panacarvi TaxID=400776 RepID=UPI00047D4A32|nr:2-dehydropantoate 2-reductase [Cohnella panacarvi]
MSAYCIVGGGSLGLLLAGKLAAAGSEVTVVTRSSEQARKLSEDGITIEDVATGAPNVTAKVRAASWEGAPVADGLTILTVKQTALTPEFVVRLAAIVPSGGEVALFQNGIGHAEKLRAALPDRKIMLAVTTEGAKRDGPTTVRHTGRGDTRIGESGLLERSLVQAGFSVILSNKLESDVMRKLLVNAVINPLTALLRIRNGQLPTSRERLELMRSLFDETFEIVQARGFAEERETMWQAVLAVCENTKHNESSMLQDVAAGRETEIEAINGSVCRLAAEQGRKVPWNEAVTALVKATYTGKGD